MKKKIFLLIMIFGFYLLTGCSTNDDIVNNTFVSAQLDDNGNVVINIDEITSEATFINYEVDEVTIQLIAVKGTDGIVHLAFNTCQSCNPSPNAYFVQKGEYFVCQNCGNRFHIDQIGILKGGCNPAPVEEQEIENNNIIIPSEYIKTYKGKFENWQGPTE